MALIGYDPKQQPSAEQPSRRKRLSLQFVDQTVVTSEVELPPISSRRALRLIPLAGGGLARAFVVREPETILGRQMGADLRVWDGKVSRQHCKILLTDQSATLLDLKSSNGTFVNGAQVDRVELEDGDLLRIGDTVLRARYMEFGHQGPIDDTYWLATRDPGTELYNREYILEALQREVAQAKRRGEPLALLLANLHVDPGRKAEQFKLLDREMRSLASALQRGSGEATLLGRYGETEMVAVFPGADKMEAEEVFAAASQPEAVGHKTEVTLHVGVAHFPADAENAEQLVERAEMELYQALEVLWPRAEMDDAG